MNNIIIKIKNITSATTETEFDKVIETWKVAGLFFQNKILKNNEQGEVRISLDVSNIIEKLGAIRDENYLTKFIEENKIKSPEQLIELAPYGSILSIRLEKEVEDKDKFINNFLDQLFISMNLSLCGSCNLYRYEIVDKNQIDFIKIRKSLSAYLFEVALDLSQKWKWPHLAENKFVPTWNWLENQGIRSFSLAKSSTQKACAIILNLSRKNDNESSDVIGITQVLESFLLTKNESKTKGLELKLKSIFGEPSTEKRWVKKLYSLRSSIAHGDHKILRPYYDLDGSDHQAEKHYVNYNEYIDKGFLIIMAILKDLSSQNKSKYMFSYHVEMKRN